MKAGWGLLVGLLAYGLLSGFPVVGGLVGFFALLFGLGALVLTVRETHALARKKGVI